MNKLTDYLDNPLTQALSNRFGAKLERLTAPDKLAIAQLTLTTIAWNDLEDSPLTLAQSMEEHGVVYLNEAPNLDALASLIDSHAPTVAEQFAIAAALCHQIYKGVYADAE